MSYIDIFNARDEGYGETIKDKGLQATKRNMINSFFDHPSYTSVDVFSSTAPKTSHTLDSWVVDEDKATDSKKIIVIPDQILYFGDIVFWNNEYWIVTKVDSMDGVYYRGSMQRCYYSIKWQDEAGYIQESFFTITSETHGLGIDEGMVMDMPKEKRYIAIQNNINTSQIKKLQRFILDNDSCWHVSSLNSLYANLIHIGLIEDSINVDSDDLEKRICNYKVHDYSLEITNGQSINMVIGNTLQLVIVTKDNGLSKNLPVNYVSSNNSIAYVTPSGLIICINEGTASIVVSLTNDPSTYKTINLVVDDSIALNGFSLDISGVNFIRYTMDARFEGVVKNNGYADPRILSWDLFADDGFSSTSLATIIDQDVSSVTIKAGSKIGFVKLVALCVEDNTISSTKRIEIKNILGI